MKKHSGDLMSSRLMPPNVGAMALTTRMIVLRIVRVHFDVEHVHIGEALEQHALAFHHRLRRQRAAIAQAENRRAVGDDGDEIGLGGVSHTPASGWRSISSTTSATPGV